MGVILFSIYVALSKVEQSTEIRKPCNGFYKCTTFFSTTKTAAYCKIKKKLMQTLLKVTGMSTIIKIHKR